MRHRVRINFFQAKKTPLLDVFRNRYAKPQTFELMAKYIDINGVDSVWMLFVLWRFCSEIFLVIGLKLLGLWVNIYSRKDIIA